MLEKSPDYPYDVIPIDHCAAIGRVVTVWADLELTIDRAIWMLMKVDQQIGACVTSQMTSIFHRMNALSSLAVEVGISDAVIEKLKKYGSSTFQVELRISGSGAASR
jgi:hypothetical protein